MMKRTLTVLKLSALAAVAACGLGGTASAQSFPVRGRFTLPYEVRCGKALLPAGQYTIDIQSRYAPALVRGVGRSNAILGPGSVDSATARPTSLRILRRENQSILQSFNWREGDLVFVYEGLTRAEQKRLAMNEDSAVVPIAMAQK
jgi:hypothetical protein